MLGSALVLAAVCLYVYDRLEDARAGAQAASAVSQLRQKMCIRDSAEQIGGSGEELLMPEEPEVEVKSFRFWYSRDDEGTAPLFIPIEFFQ